jgi:replicative DNA helicase
MMIFDVVVNLCLLAAILYNSYLLKRFIKQGRRAATPQNKNEVSQMEDIQNTLNSRLFDLQQRKYSVQQRMK